MKTSLLLKTNF